MDKERLGYIDLLKGVAISLMVMAHILLGLKCNDQTVSDFIYTFHMPLFMFMSGYVFDLKRKCIFGGVEFINIVKKRFLALIVPGTLWMLIEYTSTGELSFPWFLRTLFEIVVVVYLMMWLTSNVKANVWINIIALVFLYVILYVIKHLIERTAMDYVVNMARLQIFYPYFAFGYLFRRYEWETLIEKYHIYTVALLLFVSSMSLKNVMPDIHDVEAVCRYICAASGIMVFYHFARTLEENSSIVKVFKYLGLYSINIYLLSALFQPEMQWIGEILNSSNVEREILNRSSVAVQIIAGSILTTYCIAMCISVTKIIERSKLLNKLLFGK